jgi:hypothetical protein
MKASELRRAQLNKIEEQHKDHKKFCDLLIKDIEEYAINNPTETEFKVFGNEKIPFGYIRTYFEKEGYKVKEDRAPFEKNSSVFVTWNVEPEPIVEQAPSVVMRTATPEEAKNTQNYYNK